MSDLRLTFRKLVDPPPNQVLADPNQPAPIPASAGKAPNGSPAAGSGGGDLTEKDFSKRTYHPQRTMKSTDGVITWLFKPVKSIEMTDAAGKKVVLTFAEPTA